METGGTEKLTIKVKSYGFKWIIENFSFLFHGRGEKLFSQAFPPDESEVHWNLSLYPRGSLISHSPFLNEFVEVGLIPSTKVFFRYNVMMLTSNDEVIDQKVIEDPGYHINSLPVLISNRQALMGQIRNTDVLKIYIEITYTPELDKNNNLIRSAVECYPKPQYDLCQDLSTIFEEGRMSDVEIKVKASDRVGDDVAVDTIKAHRVILAGRSVVFAAMFEHDMLENQTNTVVIEDFDFTTVKNFLRFLYTARIPPMDTKTAVALLQISNKYLVQDFMDICMEFVLKSINSSNVQEIKEESEKAGIDELKKACVSYIKGRKETFFGAFLFWEY